eukprot:5661128-Pleurochrysis_carterae.AAC.1
MEAQPKSHSVCERVNSGPCATVWRSIITASAKAKKKETKRESARARVAERMGEKGEREEGERA